MKLLLSALLAFCSLAAAAQPAMRDLDITAPDGFKLRASFFPAQNGTPATQNNAKPAPAVLLLHMCNTTRKSWAPVAEQLSAAGISALTMDNRGFGESGGHGRPEDATPEQQQQAASHWPADFDAAFAWLASQPGVDPARVALGGGSCGVNNAVHLAMRHPDVRALVLLAGSTDPEGIAWLRSHAEIPLFTAAAADDQYIADAPDLMRWFAELPANPRNHFSGFADGRHGTEIFGPHPELPRQIVAFYVDTLLKNPAPPGAKFTARPTPISEFWAAASAPGGAPHAAQIFHDARRRSPNTFLFPEPVLNLLAYQRLQAGGVTGLPNMPPADGVPPPASPAAAAQAKSDALTLFKLNAEAYPASANAQDSLADGYLGNGRQAEALAAEQKCLELLPADRGPADFKAQLKQAAEAKVTKLKSENQ